MTDLLIEFLPPLTISLAILMLIHRPLLNRFGAQVAYYSWILVPLSVACYSLPLNWFDGEVSGNVTVVKVIFDSAAMIQQSMSVDWVAFIWTTTSLAFIASWLTNHFSFLGKLKLKSVDAKQFDVELPKSLEVYQSAHVFSPVLVGLLKQKLILPEDFKQVYNNEQQQLILQHEICHFSRNDMHWNLLAFLCLALFWFHPLVWLAYFRFRRDQELSCDQTVLAHKHKNSRVNYSKALLLSAETAPPVAFAQLSFNQYREQSVMLERIKHIKSNNTISKKGLSLLSLLSVITLSSMAYAGNVEGEKVKTAQYNAFPIMRVEPIYPQYAADQNLTGSVVLKFDILENGETDNIRVLKAKPAHVFDEAATAALTRWKYKSHNHGVIADNLVQLDFVLNENSAKEHLIERIKVKKD